MLLRWNFTTKYEVLISLLCLISDKNKEDIPDNDGEDGEEGQKEEGFFTRLARRLATGSYK